MARLSSTRAASGSALRLGSKGRQVLRAQRVPRVRRVRLDRRVLRVQRARPARPARTGPSALLSGNFTVNGAWLQAGCPAGYSQPGTNLCWSGWRNPVVYSTAAQDCIDEGAHVCSYEDFYHGWASGTNPLFFNGDWLGNVVGDDVALCVNIPGDINNFEGTCNKATTHWYRCCITQGR